MSKCIIACPACRNYVEADTRFFANLYMRMHCTCGNVINNVKVKSAIKAKCIVGNYVTFGTYPQTKAGTDRTAIEWLVLARDGNKALLISRYALDAPPDHTSCSSLGWEESTLRAWLNGTFMNKAFTSKEQKGIVLTNVNNRRFSAGNNTQDRIFMLGFGEANKYFGVSFTDSDCNNPKARVEMTAYAIEQGAYTYSESYRWFLSPGCSRGGLLDVSPHWRPQLLQ